MASLADVGWKLLEFKARSKRSGLVHDFCMASCSVTQVWFMLCRCYCDTLCSYSHWTRGHVHLFPAVTVQTWKVRGVALNVKHWRAILRASHQVFAVTSYCTGCSACWYYSRGPMLVGGLYLGSLHTVHSGACKTVKPFMYFCLNMTFSDFHSSHKSVCGNRQTWPNSTNETSSFIYCSKFSNRICLKRRNLGLLSMSDLDHTSLLKPVITWTDEISEALRRVINVINICVKIWSCFLSFLCSNRAKKCHCTHCKL